MALLALIYFCYIQNVWAQNEAAANSSRDYQYYHEALESGNLGDATDFDWRIWGGYAISITEAPYAVLYGWSCGGSLIATNWVLTAAHCSEEYFVHAGSEFAQNTQEYPISRHVYHPGRLGPKDHDFDFDYLLLELAWSIPVTAFARPIALGELQDLNVGQPVAISGWGHTKYKFNLVRDDSWMSDRLRRVWMTLVGHDDCATRVLPFYESKFNEYVGITPRMDCAEGNGGGTCFGDSGGPVVANNRLVGLVSWGPHCEPITVFSNVIIAKDWISSTTGLVL